MLNSWVSDCAGLPVSGAQFELIDGETNEPVPTGSDFGEPRATYYDYALPNVTCTFTSNKQSTASWTMVNAPVNVRDGKRTHAYRLRLKGRMRASDVEPVILGAREVELLSGVVSVVQVHR
jgi:hypothetical protein